MLLVGSYNCQLDDKNRFRMHKKLKSEFPQAESLFVSKIDDDFLAIFTETQYTEELKKILASNVSREKKEKFIRLLTSTSCLISFDEQGRATLPLDLKNSVGIEKDITLVGVFNRVEVWDTKKWEKFRVEMSDDTMFEGLRNLNV